jgi:hypothetical protein
MHGMCVAPQEKAYRAVRRAHQIEGTLVYERSTLWHCNTKTGSDFRQRKGAKKKASLDGGS